KRSRKRSSIGHRLARGAGTKSDKNPPAWRSLAALYYNAALYDAQIKTLLASANFSVPAILTCTASMRKASQTWFVLFRHIAAMVRSAPQLGGHGRNRRPVRRVGLVAPQRGLGYQLRF